MISMLLQRAHGLFRHRPLSIWISLIFFWHQSVAFPYIMFAFGWERLFSRLLLSGSSRMGEQNAVDCAHDWQVAFLCRKLL